MDLAVLKQRAAKRRNHVEEEPEKKKIVWHCGFCERDFALEKRFMDHFCKDKKRLEELRSAIGQSAYSYYSEWMKLRKLSVPPIETFSTSKLYSTFLKFAEFASKTNLPDVKRFIKLMVENNNVSPTLWCRDNVYAMYLEWYDQIFDPNVQVIESIDFMKGLVEDYKCEPSEIYKSIPIETLISLIRRRRISPWFLVSSKNFRSFLVACEPEIKDRLERAVGMGAMIARILKNKNQFEFFNQAIAEVGL